MSCRKLAFGWLILEATLLALPKHAAAAEDADACADAYELTQSAQRSGRLFEARKDARLCAAKCPSRLANDCNAWETRITAQIPSFVVQARGTNGAPLDVEVEVDGDPPMFTETGSIEAEPGPHRLVVRHSDLRVEARIDLVAGVRNQEVQVTVPDAVVIVPQLAPAPAPIPHHRVIPPWRWVVGGIGLATVATGGAVSISGEVLADQLGGSCAPKCTQSQADEVVQRWIIGGTVMGVGGVLFLTALLWPAQSAPPPSSGQGPAARLSLRPRIEGLEVGF
jgi:hypothetical protein